MIQKAHTLFKNLLHPFGIFGTLLALVIPFIIYLLPNIGQKEAIRLADLNLPLWLFVIQFSIGIFIFYFLSSDFKAWIKKNFPSKKLILGITFFAITSTFFAATQIEARHRVQSDESVFLSMAQNFYHNHSSGTCIQGEFKDQTLHCHASSNSFKTKGQSFLYTIGMFLFGSDLKWIFNAQLLLLFATAILFFIALFVWTKDPLLSFISTSFLISQPTVLFQFRSVSVEPLYIFLSALALLVFKWAYQKNTVLHWIFLALVLAFFAQTRQETMFCLFAFIVFAIPKILDKKSLKAPAFFLTLSVFISPVLFTISYYQGFDFQGGNFKAHGHFFEHIHKNWQVMTSPLLENGFLSNPFFTYFNYLFVLGFFVLLISAVLELKNKKPAFSFYSLLFLILYHLQSYAILENVSGDFSIEINQRYSLVMFPSMAFVAAFGLVTSIRLILSSWITKKHLQSPKTTAILIIIISSITFSYTFSHKKSFNANIMYNRNHLTTEEKHLLDWLKTLPSKNRLFVYARPWHFIGYGYSAVHYDLFTQRGEKALHQWFNHYDEEIYYVRGLDCWDSKTYHQKAVENRIPTTCDLFEEKMDLSPIHRVLITNNYWLEIYKIKGEKQALNDALLQVQSIDLDSSLSVSYTTPASKHSTWLTRIYINQNLVIEEPYLTDSAHQIFETQLLKPGYNQMDFIVQDSIQNKPLYQSSKIVFNPKNATKLIDLPILSHRQEWGSLQKNTSVENNKLTVNKKEYEEGFGMHAASATSFLLDKPYQKLSFYAGLDDESLCGDGISVEVLGDEQVLYKSAEINPYELLYIEVPMNNIKKLSIISKSLSSIDCDHFNLIYPTLY